MRILAEKQNIKIELNKYNATSSFINKTALVFSQVKLRKRSTSAKQYHFLVIFR